MKKSWVLWVVIVGIVVAVLIAFNYQGNKEAVSLSELFPEEKAQPVDMEYEFVTENNEVKDITMKPVGQAGQEAVKSAASNSVNPSAEKAASNVQSGAGAVQPPKKNIAKADASKTESSSSNLSGVKFTIQVASAQKRSGAEEVVNRLQKEGMSGFIVAKDLGVKGTWYRVYVGRFSTKEEANQTLEKVKGIYSGSFIISPK